jgi:hypothetical protein
MLKTCPLCKIEKDVLEFVKHKSKKSGIASYCKICARNRQKEWRKNNREKCLISQKKCRSKLTEEQKKKYAEYNKLKYKTSASHREACKNYKLMRSYGITLEEFKKLGKKCHICKLESKRLGIDHCHKTGRIRGALCPNCNTALGLFKDNIGTMAKAIRYLKKHAN